MALMINLNADMAEGFGAYDIGDDDGLLKIVRSANVACGFHAGDPLTMRRVVAAAKQHGVSVGAHPGFNDLWGFGRRPIEMKAEELEYLFAYQIGALQALATYSDVAVTHVKAHGALYTMAAVDRPYAEALARAVRTVDPRLICVAPPGSEMERAARELGLKVAREGFCDRTYESDGSLTPRGIPGAVLKDPAAAAAQALGMIERGEVVARDGTRRPIQVDTLCVHGDEPTAVALAGEVRRRLEQAGVAIVPLTDLTLD
ncbi:LamB/YcsF family protein [Hansschlegelia sp. KR7-227]|uniref:LamB/YcsF family protein n=1 Tax=Hansschlegelia sp. KR7-227 TaxID=3400914 RepID=UPI003C018CE0